MARCRCAPALLAARDELNAIWPLRDKASDGCCGDAAHQARKSDHNPSREGFARAYDYDEDIVDTLGDRELTGMGLILLGDRRTKYLIYEAQLLYPDGTVKPYSGINAHRSHLHHSIHDWAVADTSPWGIARAFKQSTPKPLPPKEPEKMLFLVRHKDDAAVWVTDLITRRHVTSEQDLANVQHWARRGSVWNKGQVEVIDDRTFLESIPVAG